MVVFAEREVESTSGDLGLDGESVVLGESGGVRVIIRCGAEVFALLSGCVTSDAAPARWMSRFMLFALLEY